MDLPPAGDRGPIDLSAAAKVAAAIAIALVGAFDLLFRLGVPDWNTDELSYKTSGWTALHVGGAYLVNPEHPPLAKIIIGVFESIFGRSEAPVRISAVLAGILTGLFVALIARRTAGDWAALAAAAVWFALPHPGDFKLERFALLDVFMAMFTTLAILFAVYWADAEKLRWALATGVGVGLATACKLPGAIVLAPISVFMLARGRFAVRSMVQVSAMGAAAATAFVFAYVPALTRMPHEIRYMVDFQQHQRAIGHAVLVAGRIYKHPPWWATLRWQWDASWILGLVYAFVIVLGGTLVVVMRGRNLALLLGVLFTNVVFFAFISGNVLPHYPYAWAPALAVVTGLVVHDIARRDGSARIVAVVIAVALAVPAVQLMVRTARTQRTDYAAAAPLINATVGPNASIVFVGLSNVMQAYLPTCRLLPDKALSQASAVVIDPQVTDRVGPRWKSHYLAAHPGEYSAHRVGRLLVYLPSA